VFVLLSIAGYRVCRR